jgi:hypothetical protein
LAKVLHAQLLRSMPESDLLAVELVSYHQDRDDVLLRHRDQPDRVTVVHLPRKTATAPSPAVFDGSFADFAARERKRHEIQWRMRESPNRVPGLCPVCFAAVVDEGCVGIWSGTTNLKPTNGPLHHSTCKTCRSSLVAAPTNENARSGVFVWEFSKWGDDAP